MSLLQLLQQRSFCDYTNISRSTNWVLVDCNTQFGSVIRFLFSSWHGHFNYSLHDKHGDKTTLQPSIKEGDWVNTSG